MDRKRLIAIYKGSEAHKPHYEIRGTPFCRTIGPVLMTRRKREVKCGHCLRLISGTHARWY